MENVHTEPVSPMLESIRPWGQLLLPGVCFDTVLVDYNFFDVACWRIFASKGLGYAIILGSVLVKLPQIIKILIAKSGRGISMPSVYLELVAFVASCAYGYSSKFPFSTYGDSLFLLIQTTIIALLVLIFSGQIAVASIYLLIQSALLWYLFVSELASFDLIWALQAANMPVVACSKMIQAVENYKNGSTGQLSVVTVFLQFAGCLARIFTSYQETGDMTLILSYVVGTLCNGIILAQVFMYWNADAPKSKGKKKRN